MQLDGQTKYFLALGGFRRATNALMQAAAGLQAAAHELDPSGEKADDPAEVAIFGECVTELRGMFALMPGLRQMVDESMKPAVVVEETTAPHADCEVH